jgi:N-acetylglucosaminyl-diphospho-decaprenol L-rhamnosyltransferase
VGISLKATMRSPSLDDITVISVTFNSRHCIGAMQSNFAPFAKKIIVDNGSDDGTPALLSQHFPGECLILSPVNLGFGAANNRALEAIRTPYALLLNPDCHVEPDFVERLPQVVANHPDAAIIAPALVRGNGAREVSYRWARTQWHSRGPEASGPCCVGFVSGAAMLLNIEALREVGFFDETFFLYYEDEDLCQRAFAHKKEIIVVPDLRVTHFSRGSVRGRNPLRSEFVRGYHHVQSKLVYERKHVGQASAARLRRKTLGLAILTLFPRLLFPHPRYVARLVGRIFGLVRA